MSKKQLPVIQPTQPMSGVLCCTPLAREPLGEPDAAELAKVFKALAGQGVEAVRPIRDDIERRIRGLVGELLGSQGSQL
jgi:hypothetical protein